MTKEVKLLMWCVAALLMALLILAVQYTVIFYNVISRGAYILGEPQMGIAAGELAVSGIIVVATAAALVTIFIGRKHDNGYK